MLIKNLTKIPHIQWIHHVSTRLNHINYSYSCKPKTFIRISWHFNSFSTVTEYTNSRKTNKYYWKDEDLKKNTFNKLNERLPMSLSYFDRTRWFCRQIHWNEMQAFCKNSIRKFYVIRVLFHETLFLFFLHWIYFLEKKKTPVICLPSEWQTYSSGNF